MRLLRLTLAWGLILSATDALADTGRIEINQSSVDAAGGFPVTISSPGNYLLTSDLAVPADTDAFVLDTSGVVFDLNGFTILGPFLCNTGSCAVGTGSGVRPGPSLAFGRNSTVRNGTIGGFGGNCVQLNSQVQIDNLLVAQCGRSGIAVQSGSLVTNNRVLLTGENGISMGGIGHPPAFAQNTVAAANLGGGGFAAVSGGTASAGNSCDDGSCDRRPRMRKFYVSDGEVAGSGPTTFCASRYHMASLWEIHDPSSLEYDSSLGFTGQGDQGSGPPTLVDGWVRTGFGLTNTGTGGFSNCLAWSNGAVGTLVSLPNLWEDTNPVSPIAPWVASSDVCLTPHRVWCVED